MKNADKIKKLTDEGYTSKQVAKKLKLSMQTVYNIASMSKIKLNYDAKSRWGSHRKPPTKSFSICIDLALSDELDAMKARGEIKSKSSYLEELARERLSEHRQFKSQN